MTGDKKKTDIETFFESATKWRNEMENLRQIALDSGLMEELKWGKPCYTFKGKNIILIQGFKEYVALLFFKGYLLNDSSKILVKTGPNTKIGRQVRFSNSLEIDNLQSILRSYIHEAIKIEK